MLQKVVLQRYVHGTKNMVLKLKEGQLSKNVFIYLSIFLYIPLFRLGLPFFYSIASCLAFLNTEKAFSAFLHATALFFHCI